MREKELDFAFAHRLAKSDEFAHWLLGQVGSASVTRDASLLHREQIDARPRVDPAYWYRHWWCKLQDGTESETDIFLVFGKPSSDERLALHVENKLANGHFTPDQEINYARRARHGKQGALLELSEMGDGPASARGVLSA